MRYELSDYEWTAIKPMLPNKPRGVRVPAGRLTQIPCPANLAYLRAIGGRDRAT